MAWNFGSDGCRCDYHVVDVGLLVLVWEAKVNREPYRQTPPEVLHAEIDRLTAIINKGKKKTLWQKLKTWFSELEFRSPFETTVVRNASRRRENRLVRREGRNKRRVRLAETHSDLTLCSRCNTMDKTHLMSHHYY